MRISEIFCSLQGEGVLMGTPTTFVRTVDATDARGATRGTLGRAARR